MVYKIEPDRIVGYYRSSPRRRARNLRGQAESSKVNLKQNHHSGKVSQKASKNIKKSISYLWELSRKRTITRGKSRWPNFKAALITLTLPAKQFHSDKKIKSKALHYFLNEIARKSGMQNYIWKAELQKNGNIHFHIVTDCFVHWQDVYKVWHNAMFKLGYIQKFSNKFKAMNFMEYWQNCGGAAKISKQKARQKFQKGKKEKWQYPPMVDIRPIKSEKQMKVYLSKYLAKGNLKGKRAKEFGRIWFRSRSLSRLKFKNVQFWDDVQPIVDDINKGVIQAWSAAGEWYVIWIVSWRKLIKAGHSWVKKPVARAAAAANYVPAGTPGAGRASPSFAPI